MIHEITTACVSVLIETLWNVKTFTRALPKNLLEVLIETLWNVKTVSPLFAVNVLPRINRNIVECKV